MSDFTITRGDDRTLSGTALEADGTPQSLTDVTLFFTAKRRRSDADEEAVLAKDADAITVVDEDEGTFEIDFAAEDTSDLDAPLLLLWDLQGVDVQGKVHTLTSGRFLIQPDITRRTEALAS